jgi:hypothetical protein
VSRKFLIVIPLLIGMLLFGFLKPPQVQASGENWLAGFSYRKAITIDHTKIDADLTDYPTLVKLNSSNFDFAKAQANGQDVRFTDSGGQTLLSYDREKHDAVGQAAIYWVKIPSVSSSTDTVFYVYYGNISATDGEDQNNVWDASTVMVQHLNETSGTHFDATANGNNGTAYNGITQGVAGQIDGADDFPGTNSYIDCGNAASVQIAGPITVSAWIKADSWVSQGGIVGKLFHTVGIYREGYALRLHESTIPGGLFDFSVGQSPDWWQRAISITYMSLGRWYYVVGTYDGATVKVYLNGTEEGSAPYTGGIWDSQTNLLIGRKNIGWADAFDGMIDEARVYNTAKSAAWIKADYSSGSNTLLSLGQEVFSPQASQTPQTLPLTGIESSIPPNTSNLWLFGLFGLTGLSAAIFGGIRFVRSRDGKSSA